jgi:hypothetical protein
MGPAPSWNASGAGIARSPEMTAVAQNSSFGSGDGTVAKGQPAGVSGN